MKKLLMGSIALTMFAISMIVFQLSCKKEANAQTTTTGLTQLNLLVFTKLNKTTVPGVQEVWTANLDGTNQKKISITLPTNLSIGDNVRLTPDGKTIIFEGVDYTNSYSLIYSCSIDGSNLKKIIDNSTSKVYYNIEGAY